jgi:ubiquinone/menaquinone biosynthesis C-methylase UbiE
MPGECNDLIVDDGNLFCSNCAHSYPIKNGIVYFICPQELKGINRRFARTYDWYSHVYTLLTKLAFLPFGGEYKARMEILDRLELNDGRILEVSIGPGVNLPYLFMSQNAGEVFGLDISLGQLARCNNLIARKNWSVDLFWGMAEALPFKSDIFDSVFHIGGINFFSGKKEAIDEMIRVARPGSKIVIADESERVAKRFSYIPGFPRSYRGRKLDTSVPIHLVPETMEKVRIDGIWKAHGQYHGYCLEFRKPL